MQSICDHVLISVIIVCLTLLLQLYYRIKNLGISTYPKIIKDKIHSEMLVPFNQVKNRL